MNYSMVEEARELAGWSAEREAFSAYQAMKHVTDTRREQGKRYSIALLLTCVLLGKMAGETTLQAIAEWIRLRSTWLQTILPEMRDTFPCAATYSNVLQAVDPEQVNQLLMDVLTRVRAEKRTQGEHMHVVLDGKTLRGSQNHLAADQKKMHQVNVYEAKTGIVLKQHMVAEKEGELTRVKELLTPVLLAGRIISADALYAQTSFCQEVLAAGGDYLLFVKQNQPTLHEDVSLFFREPPLDCLDWRTACTTNKGHGRVEHRLITASPELNDFLARACHDVGQVFCRRRRIQHALTCTQELVYGITSLTPRHADPARLLELTRDHWSIENRLRLLAGCHSRRRCLSSPQRLGSSCSCGTQFLCAGALRFLRHLQRQTADATPGCSASSGRSPIGEVSWGELNSPGCSFSSVYLRSPIFLTTVVCTFACGFPFFC